MCKALKKLTIAYLALQECAQKLQSVINATQYTLSELQAKYKTLKEQKAFLQTDRNKWFDAYNLLDKSNDSQTIAQAEELRQLKAENERLRAYVIEKDGIKIFDEVQPAPTLQELEKADAPNSDALILLADKKSGYYVHGKYLNEKQQTELLFTPNKELADTFANLEEVHDFLDDYPLENLNLRGSINMVIIAKDDNGFIQGVLDAGGSWRTLVYHDDIRYAKEFDDLGEVINFLDEFTTKNVTLMRCDPDNWHIELSISLDDAIKQYKDALQDLQVKTTEKADEAIKPVILLRTNAGRDAGGWITERIVKTNGDTTFGTNSYPERAKQFANLDEVSVFLGANYPLELVTITYHHPKTLAILTEATPANFMLQ